MTNTTDACKTCGKLDQPHDPCDCPDIRKGSVVFHRNPESHHLGDMVSGPGTVIDLFDVEGVDFAEVLWQSACISTPIRLENLITEGEKRCE